MLTALLVPLAACGPSGPLPGGPLPPGHSAEAPDDWSFTEQVLEIALETRGRWFRHSITTLVLSDGPHLYVPSRNASVKRWVNNVLRDPRVRVRIAGVTYARRAVRVTDADELAPLGPVFVRKYLGLEVEQARFDPRPPADGDERADLWFFRLDPPAAEDAP